MAEKPVLQRTDLTTRVPSQVTLTGLSAPGFDGANYFRTPTSPHSAVTFESGTSEFVQLEYQLYSPSTDVTGILKLDGRVLDTTTFPAGQFISNVVAGDFVAAGPHRFTLEYRCEGQPCAAPPSQYWTRLGQLPVPTAVARQDAGLGVERWQLYAPDSPLRVTGTGPLFFDGTNFVRRLTDPAFELSWADGNALNASMWIYAPQPFRVTTRAEGKVLDVQSGNKTQGVSSSVSLAGRKGIQALTVQIDCGPGKTAKQGEAGSVEAGSGCAVLYFPQVAVLTAPPATAAQSGGAALAVLLILTVLWHWLGLAPRRRAAAG